MLNLEQTLKLQNSYLEKMISQKGLCLDQETKAEMSYWKSVLEKEVNENNQLRAKLQQIQQQIQGLSKGKKEVEEKAEELTDNLKDTISSLERKIKLLGAKYQEATDK